MEIWNTMKTHDLEWYDLFHLRGTRRDFLRLTGGVTYVTAEVTPDLWTSEFKIVPVVTEPGAALETRATFVVENGRPGAQEA